MFLLGWTGQVCLRSAVFVDAPPGSDTGSDEQHRGFRVTFEMRNKIKRWEIRNKGEGLQFVESVEFFSCHHWIFCLAKNSVMLIMINDDDFTDDDIVVGCWWWISHWGNDTAWEWRKERETKRGNSTKKEQQNHETMAIRENCKTRERWSEGNNGATELHTKMMTMTMNIIWYYLGPMINLVFCYLNLLCSCLLCE